MERGCCRSKPVLVRTRWDETVSSSVRGVVGTYSPMQEPGHKKHQQIWHLRLVTLKMLLPDGSLSVPASADTFTRAPVWANWCLTAMLQPVTLYLSLRWPSCDIFFTLAHLVRTSSSPVMCLKPVKTGWIPWLQIWYFHWHNHCLFLLMLCCFGCLKSWFSFPERYCSIVAKVSALALALPCLLSSPEWLPWGATLQALFIITNEGRVSGPQGKLFIRKSKRRWFYNSH